MRETDRQTEIETETERLTDRETGSNQREREREDQIREGEGERDGVRPDDSPPTTSTSSVGHQPKSGYDLIPMIVMGIGLASETFASSNRDLCQPVRVQRRITGPPLTW